MNDNKNMVLTTRKTYKDIKKCDRQQFDDFCRRLYIQGFENGRDSVPGIDRTRIYDAIAKIKGIGPKKLEEIKACVEAEFEKEEQACIGTKKDT